LISVVHIMFDLYVFSYQAPYTVRANCDAKNIYRISNTEHRDKLVDVMLIACGIYIAWSVIEISIAV
jgi:hypothetical protein